MSGKLTGEEVKRIAKLAKLPLNDAEVKKYTVQLTDILEFVSKLQQVKVKQTVISGGVTELVNVYREDVVDKSRMFTQEQALKNAKASYKGFFKVSEIKVSG